MTLRPLLIALACLHLLPSAQEAQQNGPLRVFIRAGVKTHGPGQHDHPRFLKEWVELLNERGAQADGAMLFPTEEQLARTDVLVLYAAEGASIHGDERQRLEQFLGRGGGIVVLHDAVCGDDPEWFTTVVGGAWEHGQSKWQEGEIGLYFPDHEHPITAGVSNFDLVDEIYWDLHLHPDAHVLANSFRTTHEIKPQMWTFEKDDYRAFVSIPGHDFATFSHGAARTLLLRGIAWAAKRDADLLVSPEEVAALRYPEGGPTRPADAQGEMQLNESFEMQLVASEPLVINPISIDWDAQGRMWVAAAPGYPYKEEFSGIPAHDQILILEDSDGDGVMDRRQVFFEGLDLVSSLVFHRDGVIVTQAPDILFLRDTDGDDHADLVETLYTGFGYSDTHAVTSNMRWGLDGWIYATQGYSGNASTHVIGSDGVDHGKIGNGLFRFRPDGSAIEMVSSYGSNTWGCDFTWDGELFFTMANGSHLRHVVVPDRILAAGKIGGVRSWMDVKDHSKAFPVSAHTRHPYLQIDFVGGFTAAAGSMIYDGGTWPEEYWGNHFVTEPTINLVHRDLLEAKGATYVASKPRESEFLAGNDLWFRPIHLRTGPDGAMYVLDFYNQASVHNDTRGPAHGPTNAALRPDRDNMHGRIWRVQHKSATQLVARESASSPAQLVEQLESTNRQIRMTAQRLLQEAQELPAQVLDSLAPSQRQSARAKIHGLWILANRAALTYDAWSMGLGDSDAGVRKNTARVAGVSDLIGAGPGTKFEDHVTRDLFELLADFDPRVVIESAVSLRARPLFELAWQSLVMRYPDLTDDWTRSVFIGTAAARPLECAQAVFTHTWADGSTSLLNAMTDRIGRRANPTQVKELIGTLSYRAARSPRAVEQALRKLTETLPEDFHVNNTWQLQQDLGSLLRSDQHAVALAALPLAARWETEDELADYIATFATRLHGVLDDENADSRERLGCLEALLGIPSQRPAAIAASKWLLQPYVPLEVQIRTVDLLSTLAEPEVADILVATYAGFSPRLREQSFNALNSRSDWSTRLLNAVESDDLSSKDLGPGRVFRLCNHPDELIAKRATALLGALDTGENRDIDELIASLVPEISKQGDLGRGEELFNINCGICHTFKSASGTVGPDLTGMGAHPVQELLPFVLDPNRTVEDNFIEFVAWTRDGSSTGGILVREDDASIVLANSGGEVEILRDDLDDFISTGRSPMPTGFEDLGVDGLRDIFTWLRSDSEGYRVIDIAAVCTASSEGGLYDPREPRTLEFTRYGVHAVDGIPFHVLDPARSLSGNNAIVLKGGLAADWYCRLHQPTRVEIPVGFALRRLHVLGGISAWGYPFTRKALPAVKVTWNYASGATQETILHDGEHFSDWIRPVEVPGSTLVEGIQRPGSRGQVRRFTLEPERDETLVSIVLESYDGETAPTFLALTAEVGDVAEAPPTEPRPVQAPPVVDTLVVGGGSSHDFARWFGGKDVEILGTPETSIAYTEDVASLTDRLKDLRLLYLANNQPIPESARSKVLQFAAAGGGLLLVHPALWYNWNDWPEYNRELVGGGARSHESYGTIEVRVTAPDHPVTADLPARFEVRDELYRFERDPSGSPIEILALGRSWRSGEEFPVVWTVERPSGRTVCISLGHDGATHENPVFAQLLCNAASWASASD